MLSKGFLSLWSCLPLDSDRDPCLSPSDVSPPVYAVAEVQLGTRYPGFQSGVPAT